MRKNGTWIVYAALCPLVFVLIWVFGLGWYFLLPLGAACAYAVWKLQNYQRIEHANQSTYLQVTTYLEQLLCSYRRLGHAGKALEDCSLLFEEESEMGQAVGRAKHILLTGEGVLDGNILQMAFRTIEESFDSRRMRIIHQFICNGERTGAESGRSADILLEDLELWKNRTKLYQNRKHFIKIECGIASVLAVFLCYVSRLLTPAELGFDISSSLLYQASTVGAFILILFLLVTIHRKLSSGWLDYTGKQAKGDTERFEKYYHLLDSRAGSSLSRHMAKKILSRYVRAEFPYWLLFVTLYLQSESCYQALRYSLEETDGVFRKELERLIERIYDSPRSLEPYLAFFSGLSIPELQSGMKILYSIQANGYEDSGRQMDYLVAQNNRLMDKNESYVFSNKMAGMSMLKQLPMVVSCIKLLIDLVNLLAMTMGSFQNIGIGG